MPSEIAVVHLLPPHEVSLVQNSWPGLLEDARLPQSAMRQSELGVGRQVRT